MTEDSIIPNPGAGPTESRYPHERAQQIPGWETVLQTVILADLDHGRLDWDRPHTEAVVKKVKAIIDNNPQLQLDEAVLTIAAYAHDWGYVGLFEKGKSAQIDHVAVAKPAHMAAGARKLEELLKNPEFSFLSEEQKSRAIHLVRVHDKLGELKDPDELVLMEADTLGALDVSLVKPSFDYQSNNKWMEKTLKTRVSKLVTDYSKREADRLIAERTQYYEGLGKML